ncbi:hypothetical protein ILUMI_19645 [Ignelater luminosus]|uniref:Uncharacterized protein n=1 Tax=Ignelater luminosus TaxID=2038154 RepID=A0A8K0CMK2_IGNLU|nr:hypothetical protein ILUMI_19645 [Ignelater luminosus]
MVYTLIERVEIIFMFGSEGRSALRSAAVFNARHQRESVMANKKRVGQRALDEAAQIEVLGHFAATPTSSVRKAATITGISRETVRPAFKLHTFYPHKMQILQELTENDYD